MHTLTFRTVAWYDDDSDGDDDDDDNDARAQVLLTYMSTNLVYVRGVVGDGNGNGKDDGNAKGRSSEGARAAEIRSYRRAEVVTV